MRYNPRWPSWVKVDLNKNTWYDVGADTGGDLDQLTTTLTIFYEKYNNTRLHGSIANLPPKLFWKMWERKMITREVKSTAK